MAILPYGCARVAPDEKPRCTKGRLSCPSCAGTLSLCEAANGSLTECTSCGGIWLDEESFERFCDEREASTVAHILPSTAAHGPEEPPPSRRSATCRARSAASS